MLRVAIFGISKSRNGILDIEIEASNVMKFFDTEYFAKAVEFYFDIKGQYHNAPMPLKDERVWSDAKVR